MSREEFCACFEDLTLVQLAISPASCWSTSPEDCYRSYLLTGEIACLGMRRPERVLIDQATPQFYNRPDWRTAHPQVNPATAEAVAEQLAREEVERLAEGYTPYLGRPVKAILKATPLEEPIRGAPLLAGSLRQLTSVSAEFAWRDLVADALLAELPVPSAVTAAYVQLLQGPRIAPLRTRQGKTPPAERPEPASRPPSRSPEVPPAPPEPSPAPPATTRKKGGSAVQLGLPLLDD